jgi:hypothetical protein
VIEEYRQNSGDGDSQVTVGGSDEDCDLDSVAGDAASQGQESPQFI